MDFLLSYLLDTTKLTRKSVLINKRVPPPFLFNSNLSSMISILEHKNNDKSKKREIYELNYFMTIKVKSLFDEEFRQHFRLNRSTVQGLINFLGPRLDRPMKGRPAVDIEKQILLSLWTLANQDSFREIAERFDLERGHAYRVFARVVQLLFNSRFEFIKFPQGEDLLVVQNGFASLRNNSFPGTVGCVDGCQIPIPAPRADKQSYYNRNKFHSVTLQGMCNHRMMFIDCFAGWPGSSHDAYVWQNSPINQLLADGNLINKQQHILGDSAYPVSQFVMVPFRDNGHLSHEQKNFNKILSSSRVVIEQAFGLLKCRFRRLKNLNMYGLSKIAHVILACCILHNICIMNNDLIDIDEPIEDDDDDENNDNDDETGNDKRNRIAASL